MNSALSIRSLLAYASMALPLSFVGLPLYLYVPDMYARYYGLDLAMLGIVLMILRFVDAIQDPFIGILSDRFSKSRFLLMATSFVAFVISFYFLYHPVSSPLVWMSCMTFAATTAYSVLSINLNALGSLWSKDHRQKTRITAFREVFGIIGLLLAVMLLPLVQAFVSGTGAYTAYALLAAMISGVLGIFFFSWLRQYNPGDIKVDMPDKVFSFKTLFSGQQGRFFAIYGLSAMASAIPAVLVVFFIRDKLGAEQWTGLFLLVYFMAAFASVPLWKLISEKKTKAYAWLVAMVLASGVFLWSSLLGRGDIWFYAVICLVSGFAFGAELILPPSILSDLIDRNGQQGATSSYFSLYAFLTKFSLALASGFSLVMLGSSGFVPAVQNTDTGLLVLGILYAVVPCVIKLAAAVMLVAWIRKEKQHEIQTNHSPDRITSHA